ncbi:MAG: response regulator [Gammaproteobacteria bacterium]
MRQFIRKLPSILLILFSVSVVIGVFFNIAKFNSSFITVIFTADLCVLLCALGLFLCEQKYVSYNWILIFLGCLLCLIASLSLSRDYLAANLGHERLFIKSLFIYMTPNINRMAANTSFGFILCGLVFILWPFLSKKLPALCVGIFIFLIFLIGILGLFGYLTNIEFYYSWYAYTRIAISASLIFLILAFGLTYEWQQSPASQSFRQYSEDKQIIIMSSMILLTIALIAGFTGFVSALRQQNDAVNKTFQQLLIGRIMYIENEFSRVVSEIDSIRAHPLFQQVLQDMNHTKNSSQLPALLQFFIVEGFSGVNIYDQNGVLIASQGNFIQHPDLSAQLKKPENSVLLWKNGWYLDMKVALNSQNKSEGYLIAEWPLTDMTHLLSDLDMGKTAEILICKARNTDIGICFPSRMNPKVFTVKRIVNGLPLPIDYALSGKVGTIVTYDYRNHEVLAAYNSINLSGLGIVLKMDLDEIYTPIFNSLYLILALIIAVILIGILLLRLAVMPLVRKVINTECELMNSNIQLRESQERYDLAVVGSQFGLWDWKIEKDEIIFSPQLKKILGYTDEEMSNSVEIIEEIIHPDDREKAKKALESHLKNHEPYNIEYRVRAKKGEYLWVQVMGHALWNNEGRAIRMAGSIMDITSRKKNLQRSNAQRVVTQILSEATTLEEATQRILRAICEGMGWAYGGLWMVDESVNVMRNVGSWSLPSLPLEAFRDYNLQFEFPPGVSTPGIVWANAKPEWFADESDPVKFPRGAVAKAIGLRTAYCFPILLGYKVLGAIEFFSFDNEAPDSSTLRIMESIGPQVGQFILRKTAENELRESESYKTAVLESASDSIITVNDNGIIISYNSRTEKMFNYSTSPPTQLNELMPGLFAKFPLLIGNIFIEAKGVKSNKETFPIEVSVSEVVINNEHRYVAIVRDITERKKIEALKTEFVSVVSHELRTPITAIAGSISLLLGGVVGNQFSDKARKLLEIANVNCNRLLLLINDILDMNKIEAGKMVFQFAPVDLSKVVKDAINANFMYADKFSVCLALTQDAPGVMVNVDVDRLMQVLTNLISNAVKFSPTNEQVSITIEAIENKVRVSVTDKGAGISESFRSKIFQKFSQSDTLNARAKGGTGLGLNISKAIIEKLGGELGFTSEPNVKTTFYFELPRWDIVNKSSNQINEAEDMNKPKLLVCDDDENQTSYLQALLTAEGYSVDVVHKALEVKKALETSQYDALLLDLILPDQDGIALIRELRSEDKTHDLPIIVVSVACDAGRVLSNGEAVSILGWLDKPVDVQKLLDTINLIKKEGKANILHVEDDKDIQEVVAEILHDIASVSFVETVKQAREKLASEKFDLVILDLLLPDGNGAELFPELAQKKLPVVVFSTAELDKQYSKYVSKTLLKSRNTNKELVDTIKTFLKKGVDNGQ